MAHRRSAKTLTDAATTSTQTISPSTDSINIIAVKNSGTTTASIKLQGAMTSAPTAWTDLILVTASATGAAVIGTAVRADLPHYRVTCSLGTGTYNCSVRVVEYTNV